MDGLVRPVAMGGQNSSKSNDQHKLGRSGVNMCEFSHMPSAFLAKSSFPFGVLLSLVYSFFPENYAPQP